MLLFFRGVSRKLRLCSNTYRRNVSWTSLVAVVALALSLITAYWQFWPRRHVVTTLLRLSYSSTNSDGDLGVRAKVAFWNQGNRPAVILNGSLLLGACPKVISEDVSDMELAPNKTPASLTPFVLAPGQVLLRTLETDMHPTGTGFGVRTCSENGHPSNRVTYIHLLLSAVLSDGKLQNSAGLVGIITRTDYTRGPEDFGLGWAQSTPRPGASAGATGVEKWAVSPGRRLPQPGVWTVRLGYETELGKPVSLSPISVIPGKIAARSGFDVYRGPVRNSAPTAPRGFGWAAASRPTERTAITH